MALALPMDIQKIVERGLVDPAWRSRSPNDGVWGHSVVACVVRRGNPKGITDWEDLARPDVDVICANPKTAGVARWNFLAMWGHVMERGEAAAKAWMIQVRGTRGGVGWEERDVGDARCELWWQAELSRGEGIECQCVVQAARLDQRSAHGPAL